MEEEETLDVPQTTAVRISTTTTEQPPPPRPSLSSTTPQYTTIRTATSISHQHSSSFSIESASDDIEPPSSPSRLSQQAAEWTTNQWDQVVAPAVHNFFYPPRQASQSSRQQQMPSEEQNDQQQNVNESSGQQSTAQEPSTSTTANERVGDSGPSSPHDLASPPSNVTSASSASSRRDYYYQSNNRATETHLSSSGGPPPPHGVPSSDSMDPSSYFAQQQADDSKFVKHFWQTYDDIIILSLFTQIGIVARLATSVYFTFFDGVFSANSALFVNLPLNSLSCFLMGVLCSGERLMEILTTRFSPPRLQQDIHRQQEVTEPLFFDFFGDDQDGEERDMLVPDDNVNVEDYDEDDDYANSYADATGLEQTPRARRGSSFLRRRRRRRKGQHHPVRRSSSMSSDGQESGGLFRRGRRGGRYSQKRRRRQKRDRQASQDSYFVSWQPPVHLNEELRDVQLLALERRIRLSRCLVLFPVKKKDVDVMEHYFSGGYKRDEEEEDNDENGDNRRPRGNQYRGQRQIRTLGSRDTFEEDYYGDGVDLEDPDRMYRGDNRDLTFDLELQEETEHMTYPIEEKDLPQVPGTPEQNKDVNGHSDHRQPSASTHDPLMGRPPADHHDDHGPLTSVDLAEGGEGNQPDEQRTDNEVPAVDTTEGHSTELEAEAVISPAFSGHSELTLSPTNNTVETEDDQNVDFGQMIQDVQANATENISRLRRVNLAEGWDVGTTADDMSDDLMLGLRDGFCGALSSFSSWNSAMVNLMRNGQVGEAFVGYMLGLQLPIIAYRFGQHVAVYIFIWRCRREAKRDERRGYGIRLSMNETSERDSEHNDDSDVGPDGLPKAEEEQGETASVRAVATALFILALVTQITSLSFFRNPDQQQLALSLLFSPLGVLARWRLSKYNSWRPTFPIGTFSANILACALSGGFGSLLAGNPGENERIALVSIISGFGGTMSSLATFIVEILAGIDPVLFRFDGVIYAVISICSAMVVGFVFSASVDWADQTVSATPSPTLAPTLAPNSTFAPTVAGTNNSLLFF